MNRYKAAAKHLKRRSRYTQKNVPFIAGTTESLARNILMDAQELNRQIANAKIEWWNIINQVRDGIKNSPQLDKRSLTGYLADLDAIETTVSDGNFEKAQDNLDYVLGEIVGELDD